MKQLYLILCNNKYKVSNQDWQYYNSTFEIEEKEKFSINKDMIMIKKSYEKSQSGSRYFDSSVEFYITSSEITVNDYLNIVEAFLLVELFEKHGGTFDKPVFEKDNEKCFYINDFGNRQEISINNYIENPAAPKLKKVEIDVPKVKLASGSQVFESMPSYSYRKRNTNSHPKMGYAINANDYGFSESVDGPSIVSPVKFTKRNNDYDDFKGAGIAFLVILIIAVVSVFLIWNSKGGGI